MTGTRALRVAATGARVLTGIVVAAACVVAVVVAIASPLPGVAHRPAQAEVLPQPADTVLACNGDFRAIGRDPSDPLRMDSAAAPRLTVDGSAGAPESSSLSAVDMGDAGSVRRLAAAVRDRTAPLVGAAESVNLAEDDLFGFAAAPCRPAGSESWLLGGMVETGSEDLIVLTNPGSVPSTVTLSVFGTVRDSTTVIVPAGSQTALPLISIATGAEVPIVKVTATGAPVRAVLQSSLTRTLDPAGADLQDAVTAPQQNVVIPGVQVFPSTSDGSEMAYLRLMSPEVDAQAVVTVRALDGFATVSEQRVPLAADEPAQISLSSLPAGEYTVQVDSDVPLLAAVREQDGSGPQTDFAWLTPAPEVSEEVFVAVPDGPAAKLVIVNDEDADAIVDLGVVDGTSRQVTVPAGSSTSVPVDARTVYSLKPTGPVHAAVAMTAAGALAVSPVWPGPAAQQSITVYP